MNKARTTISSILIALTLALPLSSFADPVGASANKFSDRTWNANTVKTGENKFTAEIHQKWINYRTDLGWDSVDTSLRATPAGFVMDKAPFEFTAPLRSTGTAVFHNNNRFNNLTNQDITAPPLDMTIQAEGVNDVAGFTVLGELMTEHGLMESVNYVIYPAAYPSGADLIYYVHFGQAPKLEKLVKFKSASEMMPTVSFKISYSSDTEFDVKDEQNVKTRWDKKGTLSVKNALVGAKSAPDRGIGFKSFKIWDSNLTSQKLEPIQVNITPTGNPREYRLTKIIPNVFATNAVFPLYTDVITSFYPDADVETSTVDGIALHIADGSSFGTIQGGTGTAAVDNGANSDAMVMETGTAADWRKIHRSILLFNTGPTIGDTDTIASSTMSIRATATDNSNSATAAQANAHIVSSAPASVTAGALGDYDSLGTTDFGSVAYASVSTTAYTPILLVQAGLDAISKTGITKFGLRFAADKDNTEPTRNGSSLTTLITMDFADQAGAGTDPYLSVDYSAAAGAAGNDLISEMSTGFFMAF